MATAGPAIWLPGARLGRSQPHAMVVAAQRLNTAESMLQSACLPACHRWSGLPPGGGKRRAGEAASSAWQRLQQLSRGGRCFHSSMEHAAAEARAARCMRQRRSKQHGACSSGSLRSMAHAAAAAQAARSMQQHGACISSVSSSGGRTVLGGARALLVRSLNSQRGKGLHAQGGALLRRANRGTGGGAGPVIDWAIG